MRRTRCRTWPTTFRSGRIRGHAWEGFFNQLRDTDRGLGPIGRAVAAVRIPVPAIRADDRGHRGRRRRCRREFLFSTGLPGPAPQSNPRAGSTMIVACFARPRAAIFRISPTRDLAFFVQSRPALRSSVIAEALFSGEPFPFGRDARSQVNQAIALEDLDGRLRMDLSQHAQVGHHEDAVFGERRDALRLEGVDQHGGRLLHPRGVREDAAGGDQQVEGHVVDDRLAAFFLAEQVADRPLLLHAFERGGEFLVLRRTPAAAPPARRPARRSAPRASAGSWSAGSSCS